MTSTKDAQPKLTAVVMDGWHCDPECPHLIHGTKDVPGKCALSGKELGWYDYYIADCVDPDE